MKKDHFICELKSRMKERKDSQMAVSAMTGVPQTAISRLLRGMNIGTSFTLALLEYLEKQEGKTTDARE